MYAKYISNISKLIVMMSSEPENLELWTADDHVDADENVKRMIPLYWLSKSCTGFLRDLKVS